MTVFSRLRILPLLVMVAVLSFAVRIGEFWTNVGSLGIAAAQERVQAEPPPMNAQQGQDQAAPPAELPQRPDQADATAVEWRGAGDELFTYSDVQAGLYRDLSERRAELDRRSRELATREALLQAADRELEQKLRELTSLRTEIEGMMKKLSDEEEARITSLVKIYEGMRAKDAARIFNTLDIDVLLEVITRMSERRSSPIIAEMNPERARTVTILMADHRTLPNLPHSQ